MKGHLTSPWTSGRDRWSLEFSLLGFIFGPIFSHCAPFPRIWNGTVYSLSLYADVICFFKTLILQDVTLKILAGVSEETTDF